MTAPDPSLDPNAGYSDILSYYLGQWGLSSLIPTVTQLGQTGASSDQINLTLQQTPEWQARFAGNAGRLAKGLAPLDPASYLAMEDQYTQTLRAYDLPAGFYDSPDAMNNWIGNDVSASELNDRLQIANSAYLNAPDSAKQAWDQFYGNTAGTGGALAAILDPNTAESVIQQQADTAAIGGAAIQQGLTANQGIASQAQQLGVTLSSARKAYQDIATRLPGDTAMAARFGQAGQFGQTQEEQATLLGQADQGRQQTNLYAQEASLFSGHGGASDTSGNAGSNY